MTEVLYRKWRPQSFAEVAGQEAVTRTLRNSIAAGKLAHAYLFCGPRGTGKTTLGRLLAKAANCAAPVDGEPCNKCDSCLAFIEGRAIDFVEQDAASHNSVDDIRQLRENVGLTPMAGERKVYLLDEVHMLTGAAQNALLKTLEEPPPHIIFVLATTESHKVSGTIVSRCQRFDLKRIPMTATVARLRFICDQEGFSLDDESLEEIARAATGSLRDAVNALEQVVTYYGRSPDQEQVREALGLSVDARSGQLARLLLAGDLTEALRLVARVRDDGADIKQFNRQLVKYLRGLLLVKAGAAESLELPSEMAAEVKALAVDIPRADIIRALGTFGRIDFREDTLSSLPLELALVDFISQTDAGQGPSPAPAAVAPAARPAPPKPQREAAPVARRAEQAPAQPSVEKSPAPEPAPPPARENGPEPRPAAPAPAGDLLSAVRAALNDTDKHLSALLNGSCEVKSSEGERVVLGFYHTFHLEQVEAPAYRPQLEAAFADVLGRAVTIVFEHAPRGRPKPGEPRKSGHLVQAARELGARAIDDKPPATQ
ncbi:MAG TPA: DNA polymerase III subunit gamma/tau [Dehalococcoidia bacterium]|nr:DNA polymerase III subunit gamma/tau [Dehalococcoidia bacterium]